MWPPLLNMSSSFLPDNAYLSRFNFFGLNGDLSVIGEEGL